MAGARRLGECARIAAQAASTRVCARWGPAEVVSPPRGRAEALAVHEGADRFGILGDAGEAFGELLPGHRAVAPGRLASAEASHHRERAVADPRRDRLERTRLFAIATDEGWSRDDPRQRRRAQLRLDAGA